MAQFRLFVPKQSVGASLVYFDLFNALVASVPNESLIIESVVPVVSTAVAVTGLVGVDLHLTRTTAIGTGGTAATREGTDPTACSICAVEWNRSPLLPTSITARLTPSGGATAGAVQGWGCVFAEETVQVAPMFDLCYDAPLVVHPGSGIRVVQGSVASVGTIGFNVIFRFGM